MIAAGIISNDGFGFRKDAAAQPVECDLADLPEGLPI
jgi:hypothetical protein